MWLCAQSPVIFIYSIHLPKKKQLNRQQIVRNCNAVFFIVVIFNGTHIYVCACVRALFEVIGTIFFLLHAVVGWPKANFEDRYGIPERFEYATAQKMHTIINKYSITVNMNNM